MQLKEAVLVAKAFVLDLFADEGAVDPLLEEIEFDSDNRIWRITVSFLRQRKLAVSGTGLETGGFLESVRRAYRVVSLSDTGGDVISVRKREGIE